MASPRNGLCAFFLFWLLQLVLFPLPLTAFTVISPLFPLFFQFGQFLPCWLRQRDIKFADKYQNYYKDLSMRVKNREVDLLIVVNMFLTGFDATTQNTLWADKNLKMHGLIQVYSRTNRILNSVNTYGNIVCFRELQRSTDDAIALFSDKNANGIVLLRSFADYYNGYEDDNGRYPPGYMDLITKLESEFPLDAEIVGEQAEKGFIPTF